MSVQNAIQFILTVTDDGEFRKSLYQYSSRQDLINHLSEKGRGFTISEFEDAVNMQHVKCQTYEEADHLKQIEMWFNLFN
ncbi:MAG TPA: hypothetical protein VHO72_13990 [Bacteroidales bacterium]|nr:hypothetical protein [Bacteroidales bacterium]